MQHCAGVVRTRRLAVEDAGPRSVIGVRYGDDLKAVDLVEV